MHWKLKCLAFHTVARVPTLYRWMQKHITGRYHFTVTDWAFEVYSFHVKNFRGGRALEFGAGTNLLCPLLLSHAGATEVLAIDLQRLASTDRVNHVIRQLRGRLSGEWPEVSDLDWDLRAKYRIHYLAPGDASATGLPDQSVDFFCSTSTLEHIPPAAIRAILRECQRLATPDAVMSFEIDYHDHYATADGSINRFNFYRYPEWKWCLFNPAMHYQNRLRHSDYVELFSAFTSDDRIVPDSVEELPPLVERFTHYPRAELTAKNGFFTLHVAAPPAR